ncbi:MAG: hypothetical protein RID91_18245 [Azospirillaceae bacterium]
MTGRTVALPRARRAGAAAGPARLPALAAIVLVAIVLVAIAVAAMAAASPAAAQRAERVWDVAQRCFKPADAPDAPCGVTFDVATGRYVTLSEGAGDNAGDVAEDEGAGEASGLDPIVADDLAAAIRRADPDAPDGLAALRESQRLLEESLGILREGR